MIRSTSLFLFCLLQIFNALFYFILLILLVLTPLNNAAFLIYRLSFQTSWRNSHVHQFRNIPFFFYFKWQNDRPKFGFNLEIWKALQRGFSLGKSDFNYFRGSLHVNECQMDNKLALLAVRGNSDFNRRTIYSLFFLFLKLGGFDIAYINYNGVELNSNRHRIE